MAIAIPALHPSSKSKVKGGAVVFISRRKDIAHTGEFEIKISVAFDPLTMDYPAGTISIKTNLSDSAKGVFTATSIEIINSFGKHTPTIFLTGRCTLKLSEDIARPKGCRYWLMIADNRGVEGRGTPDIVGFAIHDRVGNRVAYGTGTVIKGDIIVDPA
ncbi:MAG TPA: hypothetical protein VKC90_15205 [Chitinophagaceae bacterium]|nr:hypothetical protein [Chitinophagaceae bacterium]